MVFVDAAATQPRRDNSSSDATTVVGTPSHGVVHLALVQRPFGIWVEDYEVRIGTRLEVSLL